MSHLLVFSVRPDVRNENTQGYYVFEEAIFQALLQTNNVDYCNL